MCGSQSVLVIPEAYLGTGANEADLVQSRPIPNTGNTVVAPVLVVNSSGTITITLKLQGSYDGVGWDDITSTTSSGGLDRKTLSGSAVKYTYVRVQVSVSGTTVKALVRAWLAISCQ